MSGMTPMQKWMQGCREEQQTREAMKHPRLLQAENSMHIKLAALDIDVKKLRGLTRIADRIDMKRDELLPRWEPVAREYVESGQAYPNPILVYCIIWLIDVKRFDTALAWADLAIEQGQDMPANIKSKMPAFIASSIYDWAEMEAEAGRTVEPYFQQVFDKVAHHWRLNERIASNTTVSPRSGYCVTMMANPAPAALPMWHCWRSQTSYWREPQNYTRKFRLRRCANASPPVSGH